MGETNLARFLFTIPPPPARSYPGSVTLVGVRSTVREVGRTEMALFLLSLFFFAIRPSSPLSPSTPPVPLKQLYCMLKAVLPRAHTLAPIPIPHRAKILSVLSFFVLLLLSTSALLILVPLLVRDLVYMPHYFL